MTQALPGLAASLLVVAARYLSSRQRRIYGIWPDEPAQLGIARFLGAGVRWNMHNHSTWRPGYGTLLAPTWWFTDDPTTVYRTALVLNALLGGVSYLLLYALVRRLTRLGTLLCAGISLLAALAPAVLFTTDFVWSEALLQPLYLGTLLVLLHFHARPSLATGAAAGTLAIAAFVTHSRMLPLALVVTGVAAVAAAQRRLPARHGAAIIAWIAGTFAAASWYSEWIVDRLWNEPFERNSYGGVLSQLAKLDDMVVSLAGQSWYQLVTTAGIAGLGALALARAARRRHRRAASPLPARGDALVVSAAVGSLVALSIVFMADRWRADQLVYGRYNDVAGAPLVVLGLAALAGTRRLGAILRDLTLVAGLIAVTGAVLWLLRRDDLGAGVGVRAMILGLQPFIGSDDSIDVLPITVAALVIVSALAGWAAIGRLGGLRPAVLAAVAGLVAIGCLRADEAINRNRNGWAGARSVATLQDGVLPAGATIDFVLRERSNDTGAMMVYQFYLPTNPFDVVPRPDLDEPSTPYVFARSDDERLLESGAEVAWTDPTRPMALWVLPGLG